MTDQSRRDLLKYSLSLVGATTAMGPWAARLAAAADKPGAKIRLGLVTYQWAKDWDLPTLISNCTAGKVLGVELRTTHTHGVEPTLNAAKREAVKKTFHDSPVTLVSLGSNERFDNPDRNVLAKAIEATKEFVKLSHDVGSSGVKVKPNRFHKGVARQKTIKQIGKSLNIIGAFAADYGQQIRLEVHGQCGPPPVMRQIMDIADHPNVAICWNSNKLDLKGKGLEHNFNLLKDRFGATAHIRQLDHRNYPFQELLNLMVKMDYAGWVMLECRGSPTDPVEALGRQAGLFEKMITQAQSQL